MKLSNLLKGKTVNVKTDVGVTVQLKIESAEEISHSEDLEPATRENDWYPASRDWKTIVVKFTNGYSKSFNSLNDIDVID